MEQERAFWLAWSQVEGIGPVLLRRLQKDFGSLADAWVASPQALIQVVGVGEQILEAIALTRQTLDPVEFLHQHEGENPRFWTPADPNYPRLLLEIPDSPATLYYRGKVNTDEIQGKSSLIAIVGTRDPSDYGIRWTRRIARSLLQNGFTLVSGLAEGVDTEVHRCCVEAESRTIAVMGTGVNVVYPWFNRNLYQQILKRGLVMSEYPSGIQPERIHFPRRNRIIAGLCRAVIVIEAPRKSGALITARLANDYGRDVYVLPGSLDNPKAIGCLNLLHHGAQVILSEDHLLEMLGTLPQVAPTALPQQTALPLDLEPDLQQVLQTLTELSQGESTTAIAMDQIVQSSGMAAGKVSSALLQLELMGLVSQQPGMRYQRQ